MPFSSLTQEASAESSAPNEPFVGKVTHQTKGEMKAVYSFAVQGGAIGTILLLDDRGQPAVLPSKTVITNVIVDWFTAATSGGSATVGVVGNSAVDLCAATAVASCTGLVAGVPVGTAATAVKLTAQRQIGLVIATAALTAGACNVFLEFHYSN